MVLQYQSPAKTSVLFISYDDTSVGLPPNLGHLHRWHESRFLKFMCWHELHIQSPPSLLILIILESMKAKTLDY